MALGNNLSHLKTGDIVRLKKPHPCGGYEWRVNRVGGDIGLRCQTCGHNIMTPRFRIIRHIRDINRPTSDAGERSNQ